VLSTPPAPVLVLVALVLLAHLGQNVGSDRVDDVLGFVEQLGRLVAGDVGAYSVRSVDGPATLLRGRLPD